MARYEHGKGKAKHTEVTVDGSVRDKQLRAQTEQPAPDETNTEGNTEQPGE